MSRTVAERVALDASEDAWSLGSLALLVAPSVRQVDRASNADDALRSPAQVQRASDGTRQGSRALLQPIANQATSDGTEVE